MRFILALFISLSLPTFADAPEWVFAPEDSGFEFAIVGSAMPQKMGIKAQQKMAEFSARKEFAANKETFIKSTQNSYEDSEGDKHFESNTQIKSNGYLNFSTLSRVKEWQDPSTGELFLLYAIEP